MAGEIVFSELSSFCSTSDRSLVTKYRYFSSHDKYHDVCTYKNINNKCCQSLQTFIAGWCHLANFKHDHNTVAELKVLQVG